MKRIVIISLAIVTIMACKKKEEPTPPGPNEWIVGYWEMTDLEVSGNITVGTTGIPVNGEGENFSGGYQLNADKSASYDASCDVILNIPGIGQQTIPYSRMGTCTWKLTNNATVLEVVESNGQTTIFPIKVITANILIVEQDSTFNMGGFSGTINYEVTLEK